MSRLEERVKKGYLKPQSKIKVKEPDLPFYWKGKWTNELKELFEKHNSMFDMYPDEYEEVELNDYSYDEVVQMLKQCLKNEVDIDDYTKYLVLEQFHQDILSRKR